MASNHKRAINPTNERYYVLLKPKCIRVEVEPGNSTNSIRLQSQQGNVSHEMRESILLRDILEMKISFSNPNLVNFLFFCFHC